jgi:hypothetical protein
MVPERLMEEGTLQRPEEERRVQELAALSALWCSCVALFLFRSAYVFVFFQNDSDRTIALLCYQTVK